MMQTIVGARSSRPMQNLMSADATYRADTPLPLHRCEATHATHPHPRSGGLGELGPQTAGGRGEVPRHGSMLPIDT